jgi:hypothetical protein
MGPAPEGLGQKAKQVWSDLYQQPFRAVTA